MIVWQVTNSTVISSLSPDAFYALVGAIVGAVLGFVFFVVYDELKHRRLNEVERTRVLGLLAVEVTENIIRGRNITQVLRQEIDNISSGSFGFMASPPHFSVDGWTIAKGSSLLKHAGIRNLQRWISAYTNVAMANANLESRELVKATLTTTLDRQNYLRNISNYDRTIVEDLDVVLRRLQEVVGTLPPEVRIPFTTTEP